MFPFFNMYSSKTEQILSRYRPIAPKPPSSGGKSDQAPPDSSMQSVSSASVGCRKGGRKRSAGDSSLGSPRSYKRSAANNRKQITQIPAQQCQIQQQMVPVMVDDVAAAAAAAVATGSISTVTSDAQALPGWKIASVVVPSGSIGAGSGSMTSNSYAKCPNILGETSSPNPSGTGGGGGSGSAGSFLRRNSSGNSRVSDLRSNGQQLTPSPPSKPPAAPPPISPPAVDHAGAEADRPKLVTLSLLPDTPAAAGAVSYTKDRDRDNDARLELSLCSGSSSASPGTRRYTAEARPQTAEQRVPHFQEQAERPQGSAGHHQSSFQRYQDSFHHHQDVAVFHRAVVGQQQLIDAGYLEQAYGGSSDPVVLTDDCSSATAGSVVLWSNLSYNKVVSERLGGKPQRAAGPYIDPLGLPTQLGCFRYKPRGGAECNAVLWGFLKKFMLLEHSSCSSSKLVEQTSSSGQQQHQQQQQQQQYQQRVLAPQPVRAIRLPVNSSVCLDAITEVNSYSGYLSGSLEAVESQLERDGFPAFVTDRSNRVRWVNAAYNQLVRSSSGCSQQDSCCSNATTTTTMNKDGAATISAPAPAPASAPDVCVTFQSERSPYSAVSLVGQARVDWMEGSKRCCLTGVPCEMRRLDDQHLGSLFVWKLKPVAVAAAAGGGTARYTVVANQGVGDFQQYGHEFFGVRERGLV